MDETLDPRHCCAPSPVRGLIALLISRVRQEPAAASSPAFPKASLFDLRGCPARTSPPLPPQPDARCSQPERCRNTTPTAQSTNRHHCGPADCRAPAGHARLSDRCRQIQYSQRAPSAPPLSAQRRSSAVFSPLIRKEPFPKYYPTRTFFSCLVWISVFSSSPLGFFINLCLFFY